MLGIEFFQQLGILVVAVVAGFLLGKILGWLVNKVLDQTIEKYLDKTKIGKELRDIGLDFSDTVGWYAAAFIFLLLLSWGVKQITVTHPWWITITRLVDSTIVIVLGFAFITVALLFVIFLADYFSRLVKGYREDVGELLKLLLTVGLIWMVVNVAMDIIFVGIASIFGTSVESIGYSLIKNIMGGFVAFAVGWVLADFITKHLEEYEEYKKFAPYGKYIILLIFLLVGLNAMFSQYLSGAVIPILAWGVAILFAVILVPFVIKAIRELY